MKNLQGYFHALKEPDTDKISVKQEIIEAIRQMEFRCRAGKFIDEKSIEFLPQAFVGYHGTTDNFAAQILNGIKPKKSDQRQYQGDGFYIAADRDIACYFANRKVREEKQGNAVVLKIFTSHALVGKQVPVKFKWKTTTESCYDFLKGKISGFESSFQYYVFENSLNKLYTPEPAEAVHWSEKEYQDFQKGYIGSCSY